MIPAFAGMAKVVDSRFRGNDDVRTTLDSRRNDGRTLDSGLPLSLKIQRGKPRVILK